MAQTARTFRIFVSSTFDDLKAERNALQEKVFPELRRLCLQHGTRFQAIDLRWGVREEASLDQQTMRICLDEIERCRRTLLRPNFIVLLGDRYGWRPLPWEIPGDEFEAIKRALPPEPVERQRREALLERWYLKDENAICGRRDDGTPIPAYCLQPREGEFADPTIWGTVERDLGNILVEATSGFTPEMRLKYVASATELEITHGALKVDDAKEHVFCFFRAIRNLPIDKTARKFIDLDPTYSHLDRDAQDRHEDLKRRLREFPGNVYDYEARWIGGETEEEEPADPDVEWEPHPPPHTTDHLSTLCQDVLTALSHVIKTEIQKLKEVEPQKKEIEDHEKFGVDRARCFVGRAAILDRIVNYVAGADRHPLAVYGESGSGKSAVMAKAVEQVQEKSPRAALVVRFIGATPGSSDIRSLLGGLCRQISRRYGADETPVPTEYGQLVQEFSKRLAVATADRPLVVFLDALDQLSDAEHAHNLIWLPAELPEHVRVVVSAIQPSEPFTALERKLPETKRVQLEPMTESEGKKLLDVWLKHSRRTLQPEHRAEILGEFRACPYPLYLKLAFEEARRWKSYTAAIDLSPSIPGIIRDLFTRLSSPANHGELVVARSLGYLAAAKNGLSEDELLDVLSDDSEVLSDFITRARHRPPERRLPVVVWSRLYFDLEPYLTERSADNASLLAFYHRQLREVVEQLYLAGDAEKARHSALAEYFERQALLAPETNASNIRKLSELPYQQTNAERWEQVSATLTDLTFIEAKCAAGMTYELVADYGRLRLSRTRPGPPMRTAWSHKGRLGVHCPFCLARSELQRDQLGREIDCPQCEATLKLNAFVIDAEWRACGSQRAVAKEMQPLQAHLTRAVSEFADFVQKQAHILAAHSPQTFQQAFNQPDVSAAARAAKSRWDSGSEKRPWIQWVNKSQNRDVCLMTLAGRVGQVRACAFAPDGRRIVSASADGTLKIWEAETGACLATLAGHASTVSDCAYSLDGRRIISGSWDNTIKVWDAETGGCLATLSGHTGWVEACAFAPDGRRIVSASKDKTLKIWDAETRTCLATLKGHAGPVDDCSVAPDGRRIVSASFDGMLKMWDAATGACVATLAGHAEWVWACAVAPDGRRIVSGSRDRTLRVWDALTGACLATLAGHAHWVRACSFAPDGRRIVSASTDRTLKVWDAETGACLATLSGHTGEVEACAFAPDGRRIVSASWDGTLKIWDAETDAHPAAIDQWHAEVVTACAFSQDGRRIASASLDRTLGFGRDGRLIASASEDQTLKIWHAETGACLRTFGSPSMHACAYSPDDRRIVSASWDELKLWDAETGVCVATLACPGEVRACAFAPDGRLIVSGGEARRQGIGVVLSYAEKRPLKVWDAETGACVATLGTHTDIFGDAGLFGKVEACAFAPDGRRIVSASPDRMLKIWDAETGVCLATLAGHARAVAACAFAPDGRRIVSASEDGTLKIWDAKTGAFVGTLAGHADVVSSCAFASDGRRIVSGSYDGTLKVWDLDSGRDILTFFGGGRTVAFGGGKGLIAAGDSSGVVYILRLMGLDLGAPLVTPVYLYRFDRHGFDAEPSTTCRWCGQRFTTPRDVVSVISRITRDAMLSPDQSPCVALPADAWDEPRLTSQCPQCHAKLKYNPFIVDNRARQPRGNSPPPQH